MSWQCTVIEAGGGNNDDIAISNDDALIRRRNCETANVGYILGTAALRSHQLFDQVMVPWVTLPRHWTQKESWEAGELNFYGKILCKISEREDKSCTKVCNAL
jgi:hypothetical protein